MAIANDRLSLAVRAGKIGGWDWDLREDILEWNEQQAQLMPVEIYFNESSIKEPKSDKKIKILSKEFKKGSIYKKTKSKQGYKYFDGWKYRYLDKTKLAKRHFVGAMLIKVKNKCFLFDVDRNELKHYRFNPFLVELPKQCKTIKEAYEILKPLEVNRAEKKGLKVLRQGEWFFIPTKKKIVEKSKPIPKEILKGMENKPQYSNYNFQGYCISNGELVKEYDIKDLCRGLKLKYQKQIISNVEDYNKEVRRYLRYVKKKEAFEEKFNFFNYGGELRAGENRPNSVDKLFIENNVNYVKGEVTHTGREHEPITLKNWHKAIPNTAIKSFTITGNID